MHEIARMAGFYAAHGVWSVADGETLIPMLGYVDADGGQGMDRLVFDDVGDAARAGQAALEEGRDGRVRAALVVDAYLHLDRGRVDALIVDAVEYGAERRAIKMAVPYRPQTSPQGFAVYRPKFIDVTGVEEPDYAALADAFFAGVDSHERAAAVWNEHLLDESV
ncbi:hypothetical protein [Actinomadura madurae]|uniref:hypothetical protein n=1 Tax=Actinomadura madurae TaxID=1993 RepID=UPI0020D20EAF|nr:hypothetical protein [Actinomadura madurae]MCP9952303.1 hypothetical protein [Actinomadura madurae]MCQ0006948.1 hypothetical protein [Actinomadura madurae]